MIRMSRLALVTAIAGVSLLLGGTTHAIAAPPFPAGGAAMPTARAAAIPSPFSCDWTTGQPSAPGGGRISFNARIRCNYFDMKVNYVAFELLREGKHVIYATTPGCSLKEDGPNFYGCTTSTHTLPRGTVTGGRADWCVAADVYWTAGSQSGTSYTWACRPLTV